MDRDRFARIAVVIATFVLAPVLLEMLAWYIEGEDYSASRAVTVLAVVAGLALIALVAGRVRGRLPIMLVTAMTVAAAGGLILGFAAGFGPVLWNRGLSGELLGLSMIGIAAFTALTGGYLLILFRRGLYVPHLEATATPSPSTTKRKVIGESEILIRSQQEISPALEKALGCCVSVIDQEDLHFVAFFGPEGCAFYTDVLDDADLQHFFHDSTPEERRTTYLKLGRQLDWLGHRLGTHLRSMESGTVIRTVLDVERGALYHYWVDHGRYIIGVTLDQRKVGVADDKMAKLVDLIRGHFTLPPINQRSRAEPGDGNNIRPIRKDQAWPESGS
ncbi:hypothetical protein ACTMTI_41745 [Nonomuraea sp. H19]|uniref:hypothetical protein n=1 Tax=Nonomuraea sp. H19 TaxID=3452206 RepID=UPI003F8C853E